MRIAICTVGELFGGVERHVLWMLSALQARGITAVPILFQDGELAIRLREQGIQPIIFSDRNLALFTTCKQLAKFLHHQDIRIVHAHGYKATVFCAIARRWHPFALVKTEHGLSEKGQRGQAIAAFRSHVYHLLDRAATRFSKATVCYVTKDLLTQMARHPTRAARVIPNGIASMEREAWPRPPELRSDCFNVVAVGRLEPVKGLNVAIDALSSEGMPQTVQLHIVGSGPCEDDLRMQAGEAGVAERVHFLGFRRDAYAFIAHCEALLMPSLHEGLPYTLLEAMALGKSVIASRVGGLAEVVEHEVTGILVQPGDPAALANAIQRLAAAPSLRARLGEEAQRVQRARYSLEAMTSSYLQLYHAISGSG
jgi:glycosyltransferase involved in cell wall biosynthesis